MAEDIIARVLARNAQTYAEDAQETAKETATEVSTQIAQELLGAKPYVTWAVLSAVTATDGTYAFVLQDSGQHTDPKTSATVSNMGYFEWQAAYAGWVRESDTQSAIATAQAALASKAEALANSFATLSALKAYTGVVSGDQTRVTNADTANHTAVSGEVALGGAAAAVGAAIPNEGAYTYSGTAWLRTADTERQKLAALVAAANGIVGTSVVIAKLFTLAGYYRLSTGALIADTTSTWISTPLIEVAYLDIAAISLYGNTSVAGIAFYDSAKTFISGVTVTTTGSRITTYPTPPTTAKYVAFTEYVSDVSSATFTPILKQAALPDSGLKAGTITTDVASQLTLVGYVKTDGATVNSDSGWLHSDYIECNVGDTIALRLGGHTVVSGLTFYDGNGKVFSTLSASAANTSLIQTVTVPSGVRQFRIAAAAPGGSGATGIPTGGNSAVLSSLRGPALQRNPRLPAAAKTAYTNTLGGGALLDPYRSPQRLILSSTSLVGLSGDSRSSTDYTWYQAAMATLTGASVAALGLSGSTVAQQAAASYLSTVSTYLDAGSGDALLIHLPGGNDNGAAGTVGTFSGFVPDEPVMTQTDITAAYAGTTFIQAVDHFVRYMLTRYANPRTRAALTGSETEAQKNAKIAAVVRPKIVLCTDLPQQRNSSTDPFSLVANWERKRAAIIEVGHKNKVHTVDLLKMCGYDMSIEPFYTSPTDKVTNNGVDFMDGLHPNQFGATRNAGIIVADLGLTS